MEIGEEAIKLEEVQVVAARPLIEVQPDKTVLNVDGSINATGNTALELLRKSPGVVVDNNDNIILAGKNGVQIYLDGKPTYLSAEDLAVRLNAMQSSEIDAIEIITDPSAKYDAEGNAGIINIRFKKDKSLGFNAGINLGWAYSINHRYNGGVNFNFRNKKANFYGAYNHNDGRSQNWFHFLRLQNGIRYDLQTTTESFGAKNSGRIGVDYFINKKSTIGFLVSLYDNVNNRESNSETPISFIDSNEPISLLISSSDNLGGQSNIATNLNYTFNGDKKNSFNVDLDFAQFDKQNLNVQPNAYFDAGGETQTSTSEANALDETDIFIYTAKADYEQAWEKDKIGFGVKYSLVGTDNHYEFENQVNNIIVPDDAILNDFSYDENINAAYVKYDRTINKKWKATAGVRMEQTNSEGILVSNVPTENDSVKLNYLDFFPSAGVTYQANYLNQFRLNYSRRIDRPSYQDLNPFIFRLTELSFVRGNPFLQPQYSNNITLAHTYKYTLTTSLSYSYTKDFFANISDSSGVDQTFLEPINLDYQKVYNLNVSYPFSPKNWWNTFTNVSLNHKNNFADLGEGRTVDIRATYASIYHQSTFIVGKGWSLELSGWGSTPSIWGAVYETDALYSIDTGVKKKLFKDRGNLKIAFTDIFLTTPWRGVQDFAGFYSDAQGGWESRQIRVNFSYLFGNNQVKDVRKRKTGLEDEKSRVKTN